MQTIKTIAILGAGTMGAGIAGLAARAGFRVLLLDLESATCEKAKENLLGGRNPVLDETQAQQIECDSFAGGLPRLGEYDWICEAIYEDLAAKQKLFQQVAQMRAAHSLVSTNTSGIPLRDICADLPQELCENMAVTHFFNPAHIMRLVELVPGENTTPQTMQSLADFLGKKLDKGVVYAKDTVNFIGNRIGCFWILCGLHQAEQALMSGDLTLEQVDALMSTPLGFPPTGLYGLVDLIGLDVMHHVGENLKTNLPANDPGRQYITLPPATRALYDRGQIGRKSGGGFYKLLRHEDGSKTRQVFDLRTDEWRDESPADPETRDLKTLIAANDPAANLVSTVMLNTLTYAANLVPDIADDIVNIDRAMRWGFNWQQGPFEMLDKLGLENTQKALADKGLEIPRMLTVLKQSGNASFYADGQYLTTDGKYQKMPAE